MKRQRTARSERPKQAATLSVASVDERKGILSLSEGNDLTGTNLVEGR